MEFSSNDTQRMIADTVRRLLDAHNDFDRRRRRLSVPSPDRLALWPNLVEAGVIGAGFPEELGGFGGNARDVAVVMYEIGRSLVVEPVLAAFISGRVLQASGERTVAEPQIAAIIGGERILVLAHAEGPDPFAAPHTEAIGDGLRYLITGTKPVVRHADLAHAFIVTAHLPGESAPGLFLVESAAPGVSIEPYRLIDAASAGTLRLDKAAATLLVDGAAAARVLLDTIEWAIVALAAEAIGIFDTLNAATRAYLQSRVQFGVPIASFQALQHRAADMYIACEEAAISTDALLDGMPAVEISARASALKVVVDRAGRKIGHEAVQLHGGAGVSEELNVSHYLRRLAAIRAEFGGENLHLERFRALSA